MCLSKCPYCDFYSVVYEKEKARAYKDAVIRNLAAFDEEYDSVYFGGGTPVLLYDEIAEILKNCSFTPDAEITVEANPCCTDENILLKLRNAGVNRISFGVQSLCDDELHRLGRRHNARQATDIIKTAHDCGFDNISADLMLGTPSQTLNSMSETIRSLCGLPLTHISAYMLKIEPNTPFYEKRVLPADEELFSQMYMKAVSLLEQYGFHQYEISNFAKTGFECRHNLKYWNCDGYIGIGASAHSFYGGKRYATARDIDDFILSDRQKTTVTDENPRSFEEYAMLRLRLNEGLFFDKCGEFGVGKSEIIRRAKLIPEEYINIDERHIALTVKGFPVSNHIIGKLLGY